MSRPITLPDLGTVFGLLTVGPQVVTRNGRKTVVCTCSCGGSKTAKPSDLRRGTVTSCGCSKRAVLLDRNSRMATHRMSGTPEHHIWRGILTRCLCKTSKYYPRYGARGITVCAEWEISFQQFIADMGMRPNPGLSVERLDNDGPYSPSNCVWASSTQQNRNRRNNRVLTSRGRSLPVSQWAEEIGITPNCLFARLHKGWTVERALSVGYAKSGLARRNK